MMRPLRAFIIARCAALSIPCREVALSIEQALTAEEIFLSNSLFGLWPVAQWLDEAGGDLGWRPGGNPVLRRLQVEVNSLFLAAS